MGKRVAIISSVILVIALAIMGYYLQLGNKTLLTDPYKSVTRNACVIIETVDLQSFLNSLTTGKGLFGETGKVMEFAGYNKKLKYITDQLNNTPIQKYINDGSGLISFYPAKDGKLKTLLSLPLPPKTSYRDIKAMLSSLGVTEQIESKINGKLVLKLPYTMGISKDSAYLSVISGLLLLSSSEDLIKNAILQLASENDVRTIPGFSRVLLASGKNEDKIFVVFANLPELFRSVMTKKGQGLADKIIKLAGTAGGDIYINEDGVVLSGYTESTDSSEYLNKYKSLPSHEFQTYKILPTSAVLFETIIISAGKLTGKPGSDSTQEAYNLAVKIREFTGDEITRAYLDIKDKPVAENTLVIYELKNRVAAEQLFIDELGADMQMEYFEPDDQTKIPVYKTPFNGLINILQPGFAPDFKDTYFTFFDNYMVTGNSFVTISKFLYENILNKTLANDLIYRDFESSLPTRSNYFFYCVPSRITEYLSGLLNENIIKALKSNRNSLNKIQAIGYQFASSNGMIYNSLSIRFKEQAREESTTEWETLLDTVAAVKPFFFTNHITGAKEIFIQDMKNNSYLINAAGRVLWKVPLSERITGNIYMIDYFRNGKYQLIFSGRNFIHLLDRNGNYVERYPVKLRSPATNSISLVDYDNNLNYRLFIAGEDKMIYSYDKTGSVVRGWKPFRTSGYVKTGISYFKESGKDYLIASDETSVYFLDRSGNKRTSLQEPVTRAVGSALRLVQGSQTYLICTSPDGTVQQVYFDGSVKKFSLGKFSIDHSFDIFDVDGDGVDEYIFIDRGRLYLYNHNKTEMFSREFGSAVLGGPINFIFSASDRKIGVFDIDKKLIYLIDKNGETMKGFPLKGASMFSIGKLSEKRGWNLIVGGTDRFLYNYKLEEETK